MRIYDDPIEVRRGQVTGATGDAGATGDTVTVERTEGPSQFLWHGRLWKVRAILAHWVETGEWWRLAEDDGQESSLDLLREREWWRVEAGRNGSEHGVFELFFDWSAGSWRLAGCLD